MSPALPLRKGWCPSLLSPMQSGDGWLVRVKPTGACLRAAGARAIADGAARHGNGHIDLTNRANLQVRGLTPKSAEAFAGEMLSARLAHADEGIEQIRNVMASPLGADDTTSSIDSRGLAKALEDMLAARPEMSALPAKFGLLVDAGGVLPLTGVTADITLRAYGEKLVLRLEGSDLAAACEVDEAPETVCRLALAFLDLALHGDQRPNRMRALVLARGAAAIFERAGLEPVRLSNKPSRRPKPPIGFKSNANATPGLFGVGLPFGRIDAAALLELAGLTEKFGDGTLRLTPWRALLIVGPTAEQGALLSARVSDLGLIVDRADPRLRINACVGKPACECASVDARTDAVQLAPMLPPNVALHVSGCLKGCAHPGAADLTLVGRLGRYDVIRHANASAKAQETGLILEQVLALLGQERGGR
jgi:precorrin-3B synthase